MDVSVVIPNYNGEAYILECIESIYRQMEIKKNIIVVDNHSTDHSISLIKSHFPDITLMINPENYGFAYAVNQGIKECRTQFVILLNNDAFVRPGFVKKLYECINQDEKIFSVSSKMLSFHDPNMIDNAGDQFCITGWAFKTGDGDDAHKHLKQRVVFSACAGAAIYRMSVFEEIGYFDENFFAYLEDVDIGFRANLYGYKNLFCPEAEVLHVGSATSGATKYNNFKVKISARNNVYVLYKNLPVVLLVVNLPFLIIGFLIKILFFVKKGFGKQYLAGLSEGFRTLNTVKRTNMKLRNVKNWIRVEWMMISSTIYYFIAFFDRLSGKRKKEFSQDESASSKSI